MTLNILKKQLDESTLCPLCQAAMYFVDAEQFDQDVQFYQCSHCEHRVFHDDKMVCHCERCSQQRKKMIRDTRAQEQRKNKTKDDFIYNLENLSLVHKLFLLSLLDERIQDNLPHDEYIHWQPIKYQPFSPNYLFQNGLIKELIKLGILVDANIETEEATYYIKVRLDGYNEPSIFSVTQQLRHWFYHNLSLGVPYKSSDEVKQVLSLLLYQEIIQFMQMYCRTWAVQIAGNRSFEQFCYRLMDALAVGQIYYLVQTALEYLHSQKLLHTRNENFINTNLLKKTLMQYRERALAEKWETSMLPRPMNLPFSKMSQIFFTHFLNLDDKIFMQPIWRAWRKIEPRLSFYSVKRCMYCGSYDLDVEYDANDYVTLTCRQCKHQDHYFTQ